MDDKSLTESINKQYPKYGSLRVKEQEQKIELHNEDEQDPAKFFSNIDTSIKNGKDGIKKVIDKSTISQDYDTSSFNGHQHPQTSRPSDSAIPMVKIDRQVKSNLQRLEKEKDDFFEL